MIANRKKAANRACRPVTAIRRCHGQKCTAFGFKGVPLPGVHPTISSLFYPSYSYEKAKLGPLTPHAGSSRESKVTRHTPGVYAGLLVDRELKRTIKLSASYNIPSKAFASLENQQEYAAANKDRLDGKDAKLVCKKLASGTTKLWQAFAQLELQPVDTQVPVGCQTLRVATAVDVVCMDKFGRHCIVEIKTGFENYYHRHTGTPLAHISPPQTDSPANQHQLQLFVTEALFRRTFPGRRHGPAFVLRVDSFGVDVMPLQTWTKENAALIFTLLSKRRKK